MFLGCDSIACFSSYRSHKGVVRSITAVYYLPARNNKSNISLRKYMFFRGRRLECCVKRMYSINMGQQQRLSSISTGFLNLPWPR